jgi:hypothetical protein
MLYIQCENEYGNTVEGIFEDREVADQVCAFLNKMAAMGGIVNQWIHGEFTVQEMVLSKSAANWKAKGASFDFSEMIEEIEEFCDGRSHELAKSDPLPKLREFG